MSTPPTTPNTLRLVKTLITTISVLGLGVAVRGILAPSPSAIAFGFHTTTFTAKTANQNPFIPIAAGRVIAPMVGGLVLLYLGYDKALGVSMMCGALTGIIDGCVVWRYAGRFEDSGMEGEGKGKREGEFWEEQQERVVKARAAAAGHVLIPAVMAVVGAWVFVTAEK